MQLELHHQTQPSSKYFSVSRNKEKTSSIPKMNTRIGVSTLQQSGVNSSSNIGDNSMFGHGVNTIGHLGVNANRTFGANTRPRQGYKAHKARRTYGRRDDRFRGPTNSRSDNRFSKVGVRDFKSRIQLLLSRHPEVKRKFSAIIKNWINAQRYLISLAQVRSFISTSCSGIYETQGLDWDTFHDVIIQCVRDKVSNVLLPRTREAGAHSRWAHKETFTLAVKPGCEDELQRRIRHNNNLVSTPSVENIQDINNNQDQHAPSSSKASKAPSINNINNGTTYPGPSFSNEGSVSCLTQPEINNSPSTGRVRTPLSSDDLEKKLPARQVHSPATLNDLATNQSRFAPLFVSQLRSRDEYTPASDDDVTKKRKVNQVSTPAAMFPNDIPCDGSEKLFESDDDDVIDMTSKTDNESSKTSVFTLDKSIQHIKHCNMVHTTLYQDAVMRGGQEIFEINNNTKRKSAMEKSVLKTHEHLLELQQLHKDAFRDNRDTDDSTIFQMNLKNHMESTNIIGQLILTSV